MTSKNLQFNPVLTFRRVNNIYICLMLSMLNTSNDEICNLSVKMIVNGANLT